MAAGRRLHIGLSLSPTWLRGNGWRRPDSRVEEMFSSDFYLDAARKAERAKLDFVFKPDALFLYTGVLGEEPGFSSLDPLVLMTTLARETSRIGLVTTASTTFNPPYVVARQLQSLDQVSAGRAGWNSVTSLDGNKNFGLPEMPSSEDRYAQAREFIDVVRRLCESYPSDALIVARESGRFADPDRVHSIDHVGTHFTVAGPLTVPACQPGPLPLFQAGGSPSGLDFAARFADAVFAATPDIRSGVELRDDLRRRAVAHGRDADAIRVLPGLSLYLGETPREARELYLESQAHQDDERKLRAITTMLGVDVSGLAQDQPIPTSLLPDMVPRARSTAHAELLRRVVTQEQPTLAELLRRPEVTSAGHWTIVGTVADAIEEIAERATAGAADGFIALPGGSWGSLEIFVEQVIPALVKEGLFREEYTGTTLRDHLNME